MIDNLIGITYMAVLFGLALYALHIVILIVLYLLRRRDPPRPLPAVAEQDLPFVTVQIPLRNERYVVHRILQAIAGLAWPKDRLEVQVLDDSNDDTTALAEALTVQLRETGLDITLLHRQPPQGFKAGALAEGLRHARGEVIALFDADFCPPPDFLHQTVPYLVDDVGLGMVQARWGHLNAEYSAFTRAQALALDAHFTVEHIARNRSGLLMNFNGAAGVWRRQAIEDAGGWQSDTVAEDLDLSYRAQLRGWRALYLPDVVAEAELPPLAAAFKQQQYRWAKGAAQTWRKLAGPIARSQRLDLRQKCMALLHLSGYATQPLFLAMLFLALPLALFNPPLPSMAGVLGAVIMIPPLLYLLGQIALYKDWPKRIAFYPVLMLLGMGLAWSNTLALLDGLTHWGGPFLRTPKFHLRAQRGDWRRARYRVPVDRAVWGELLVGLYALVALWQVWALGRQDLLPLALVFAGGELLMIWSTLHQAP